MEAVETSTSGDTLNVDIVTNAPYSPPYRLRFFRKPDRLIMDIRGFRWKPGNTTTLPVCKAGIERIRVGRFRCDPDITRVAFDLAVKPNDLRYRTLGASDAGRVRFNFCAPGQPMPPEPASQATPSVSRAGPESGYHLPAQTGGGDSESVQGSGPDAMRAPVIGQLRPDALMAAVKGQPRPDAVRAPVIGQLGPDALMAAVKGQRRPHAVMARATGEPGRGTASTVPVRRSGTLTLLLTALAAAAAAAPVAVLGRDRLWRRGKLARARRHLESEDELVRLETVRGLRTWPTGDVRLLRDSLLGVSGDSSPQVAKHAGDVIADVFPVGELLVELGGEDPEVRRTAALLLAHHPAEHATEALLTAGLAGPSPARDAAVRALAHHARAGALLPILRALSSAEDSRRALAVDALKAAGRDAVRCLQASLGHRDPLMRSSAADALGLLAADGSAEGIAALLADPVTDVRAQAARTLGVLRLGRADRDALVAALDDLAGEVREAAALSLARLGREHLPPLLERALKGPALTASPELVEAVAAGCGDPSPDLTRVLSAAEVEFGAALADALEQSGTLDEWVKCLAGAGAAERGPLCAALEAAAGRGHGAALRRGLDAASPDVQRECARLLGLTGDRAAVGAIGSLLLSPEPELRVAAVEALGRIGAQGAAAHLVSALEDPVADVREVGARAAAQCLSTTSEEDREIEEAGESRAALVAALRSTLCDRSPGVRAASAAALCSAGAREAAPDIVGLALRDPNQTTREAATAALEGLRPTGVAVELAEVLMDTGSPLRRRAIDIVIAARDAAGTPFLLDLLADDDLGARETIARGLEEIADRSQLDVLAAHLTNPNSEVRLIIVQALGKLQAVEHVMELGAAASDPDPRVRVAVLEALGMLRSGAADCLDAVTARLSDADAEVRARALEALASIAPESEDAARRAAPLIGDPDPSVRDAAVSCLLGFAERGVHQPLIELLSDVTRRPQALELLQRADEAAIREILSVARSKPESAGRTAVDMAVYALSRRWTADHFRPEIESLDPKVRLAAVEGLGMVGSSEAIAELCRLLGSDPSREVRCAVVDALAHRATSAAQDALRSTAESDPDSEVREAAAAAIGEDQASAAPLGMEQPDVSRPYP